MNTRTKIYLVVCGLIYTAVLLYAADSKAQTIVGVHTVSAHTERQPYQNNVNPGLYVIHDGWTGGVYRNTIRRTTVYGGYTLTFRDTLSLTAGLATGYDRRGDGFGITDHKVIPMVAPSAKLGPVRVWYVPSIGRSSSVFNLSLEKTL